MVIDIIGGGVAGCGVAMELARRGYFVNIIESQEELLMGSSNATPCRLSLGFHQAMDYDTAVKCLKTSIGVIKKYPGFKIIDRLDSAYLRRSHYFITKDSFLNADKALILFESLRDCYRQMIQEDSSNEVFGHPDEFFKVLDLKDYEDLVDTERVALALDTVECTLDWVRFRKHLIDQITSHPNIRVQLGFEVHNATKSGDGYTLVVRDKHTSYHHTRKSHFVINSSWQNIEYINRLSGFHETLNRSQRTKVMVQVMLPKALQSASSMFFGMGPHCCFTNLGDGTGYLTYEPVTNIEVNDGIQLSKKSTSLITRSPDAESKVFGDLIIEEVGKYIHGMEQAVFMDAKFGVVKTYGPSADIYSKDSQIHKRTDNGITEQSYAWISNPSLKLLFFEINAREVADLVDSHLDAYALASSIQDCKKGVVAFMFSKYKMLYNEPLNHEDVESTLYKKGMLNAEIKTHYKM